MTPSDILFFYYFFLNSAPQSVFSETARMSNKKTIHIQHAIQILCAVCVLHVRARWRDHRSVGPYNVALRERCLPNIVFVFILPKFEYRSTRL